MTRSGRACPGSGQQLGAAPRPRLDKATGKYVCAYCGRLIAANTNLQLAAWCLSRHNRKAPKSATVKKLPHASEPTVNEEPQSADDVLVTMQDFDDD